MQEQEQLSKTQFVRAHPLYGYGSCSSSAESSDGVTQELEIDRMRREEFAHMCGTFVLAS